MNSCAAISWSGRTVCGEVGDLCLLGVRSSRVSTVRLRESLRVAARQRGPFTGLPQASHAQEMRQLARAEASADGPCTGRLTMALYGVRSTYSTTHH